MSDLYDISSELRALAAQAFAAPKEPETPAQTSPERQRAYRQRKKATRHKNIAILDLETDPFDNNSQAEIHPFCGVLYSEEFETIVIWEADHELFVEKLYAAIIGLPGAFTIYAHNGGKFDFMFLIHKLRGEVSFKGRGIMRANIGEHEIRDSYHIIPERLANMQKQDFDYAKLNRATREKYKVDTIAYCISDCKNLLYFVKKFIENYGFKISVGAAAIAKLSENYKVEKVAAFTDERLRRFFMGGRVECIAGAGYYSGNLKLYDVNSMYPFVMATFQHPIGSDYVYRDGKPNKQTCFLRVSCKNNGALLGKDENGDLKADIREGEFFTSINEFNAAKELGLIWNIKILECVDNMRYTNFKAFVTPLYEMRAIEKARANSLPLGSEERLQAESESLFLKLIMNNAYGKFAQNPRKYKEHFLTDPGDKPPVDKDGGYDDMPEFQGEKYWIWSRPAPSLRFNNVGTAASITGAARSILLRAIHAAKNPIYCDTDSIICEELRGFDLHSTNLGAWDLEKEITELIVCGKKLYAYKTKAGKEVIKSKGASGLEWNDMLELLYDEQKLSVNKGPTLTRRGDQYYISRRISRTAPLNSALILPERIARHASFNIP